MKKNIDTLIKKYAFLLDNLTKIKKYSELYEERRSEIRGFLYALSEINFPYPSDLNKFGCNY